MKKRLVLLVCQDEGNEEETFVVAAWEEGILDVMDAETIDGIMDRVKKEWSPDSWNWREVICEIDDEPLLKAFEKVVVQGEVVE